jgi:hypothetical protein
MESIGIQALMVNNRRIFVRLEGDTEDDGDSRFAKKSCVY